MAADVVAYSHLIRADEDGTLMALSVLREGIIDPTIADYDGPAPRKGVSNGI